MLGKKFHRAPQDRIIEFVAQVGDHAESGIAHQIGSYVVANSFDNRGPNEGDSHHRPGIVELRRKELVKIDWPVPGDLKQQYIAAHRIGIQHTIKDRPNQDDAKGVQQADRGQQNHGGKHSERIRAHVVKQSQ